MGSVGKFSHSSGVNQESVKMKWKEPGEGEKNVAWCMIQLGHWVVVKAAAGSSVVTLRETCVSENLDSFPKHTAVCVFFLLSAPKVESSLFIANNFCTSSCS